MARIPLFESVVAEDQSNRLVGIPDALVQVLDRTTGDPATVYTDEVGGSGSTSPLVSDARGRFDGWVDPGQYSLQFTVGGVVSANMFSFDAGLGEAVIPDTFDLAPTTVEPVIDVTPKTTGMFFEFDQGVTGVPLSLYDPPQSNFYTSISAGTSAGVATASLTYSNSNLLAGLPGSVKCSSNGGAGNIYFTVTDPDFLATSDHYGTLYIRLDTANTVNIRPLQWNTGTGSSSGNIRITTAQKVAIVDRNNVQVTGTSSLGGAGATASTTVLSAGGTNWYRLEWHLSGTTAATVTVRIYVGHSTTITETLTFTGVDLRDARGRVIVGNASGASLAGHDYQLAAVAEGGTDWFGPYPGAPRCIAQRILNTDGTTLFEIRSDGTLVKRTDRTINRQPGGAGHYQNYRGEPMFRIDPVGSLMIGSNSNYGSSVDYNVNKLADIFLNAQTGRISAASMDLCIFNDPSDLVFSRKYPMYPSNRTGTGAATTTGTSTVTFTDLTLELLDVGRRFTIDGTSCHITGLNSGTSCEMDVVFGATASGLAWMAQEHAYPAGRTRGVTGTGSHDGQIRLTMPYTPFIRQSTIGTCTMTSANPGVVTKTGHHLVAGDPVVFTTTGTLPTNIVSGTVYYVIATGLTSNAFQVSATVGGAAIDTTAGVQAPTHTVKRPLANVTSGSGVILNMPGFTGDDVSRALLFKTDFTLGEFNITAVTPNADPALASVTVAKVAGGGVPLFTDAAASWQLTGGTLDFENPGPQPYTEVMGTAGGGMRIWDNASPPTCSGPTQVEWTMTTNDVDHDGLGVGLFNTGTHSIFKITGGNDSYGRGCLFGGHAHIVDAGKTLGYRPGLGVGAVVNQGTSKATGVTIDAVSGQIKSFNDALNAGISVTFTVTNSFVAADDIIVINVKSGRAATYQANVTAVATGSFDVRLQNYSGSNQSDFVFMNFAIIKGAGTT